MKLVGMMDSPYTRRVAISMEYYQIKFDSLQISVFSEFDKFALLSPVVKAPTLVFDDGSIMLDSANILFYLESISNEKLKLLPSDPDNLKKAHILLGIIMTACDKAVQNIYEHHTRPSDKLYEPWLERVTKQLNKALNLWEKELDNYKIDPETVDQVVITSSVVWSFIQSMLSNIVPPISYPNINFLSKKYEILPNFKKYI